MLHLLRLLSDVRARARLFPPARPSCRGRLRLLATIEDRAVVETILMHLGLPADHADHVGHWAAWQANRDGVLATGSRPSASVITATAYAMAEGAAGSRSDRAAAARRAPPGTALRRVVHAVLAVVALRDTIGRTAAVQARLLGAIRDEVAAAIDAVEAALEHPLLQRARTAPVCRRETPLTLRGDDGTLIEGVVDLAFLDDGSWTVVDFKTDQELTKTLDTHRRQVALYAQAIATATGASAHPVLLRV
jgi:PD-(D/E)XK nuclease superfamily